MIYEPELLNRWYTIPDDYGHLSSSWWRRLYLELIWRLRGREGLDRWILRSIDAIARELALVFGEEVRSKLERLALACEEAAIATKEAWRVAAEKCGPPCEECGYLICEHKL